MKVTKRILAFVLAVAMIVGMVAVGAYATITDYYNWNSTSNPYTAKIITKLYLVDTSKTPMTETEITANKSGNYEVVPGEVIRVETWVQSNFFVGSLVLTPAYTNTIFLPTRNKANNFTTYTYINPPATVDKTAVLEIAPVSDGDRDGSLESAPYEYKDGFAVSTGIMAGSYSALKSNYPNAYKGSGTTETNYLSADGFASNLNFLKIGYSAPTDSLPAKGYNMIITTPEKLFSFYLKVDSNATVGSTGTVGYPAVAFEKKGTTASTAYLPVRSLKATTEFDNTTNFCSSSTLNADKKLTVAYPNTTTTGDIVYELDSASCPISVIKSHTGGGGDEVNKDALNTAITNAKAITSTGYTTDSWTNADLATVIAAAENVAKSATATQTEVDAQVTAIAEAIAKLVVDKDALNTAITNASAITSTGYTSDSWTTADLANVIKAAQAVYDDDDATVSDVAEQVAAIADAIAALKVDKTALNAAITQASAIVTAGNTGYTTDSWTTANLANVVSAAQTVYNNSSATISDVAAQVTAISNAIAALKVDKTALNTAITNASAIVTAGNTGYTTDSWTTADLANVVSAAQTVYNNSSATISDVAAQVTAINNAIAALKVDKTALNTAITNASAIVTAGNTGYTADSWTTADLANVVSAAQTVYNNSSATISDVAAQVTAISNAIAALEVDKTALNTAITNASAIVTAGNTGYTTDSWTTADLANVIKAAQDVYDDDDATVS
ncbi:MAG TPA: hypothetical protein DDY98_09125, partial [Ruminococcaceae bacterium]|nr:hypothetical protein [Oscillospiraceae bacterium]